MNFKAAFAFNDWSKVRFANEREIDAIKQKHRNKKLLSWPPGFADLKLKDGVYQE